MATMFNTIDATRVAQGKLWTPELSLDIMGNNWSLLSCCFDWGFPEASANGTTGTTIATWYMGFPDSYSFDSTFDSLEWEVNINIACKSAGAAANPTINVLVNGVTSATQAITTGYVDYNFTITSTISLPIGNAVVCLIKGGF